MAPDGAEPPHPSGGNRGRTKRRSVRVCVFCGKLFGSLRHLQEHLVGHSQQNAKEEIDVGSGDLTTLRGTGVLGDQNRVLAKGRCGDLEEVKNLKRMRMTEEDNQVNFLTDDLESVFKYQLVDKKEIKKKGGAGILDELTKMFVPGRERVGGVEQVVQVFVAEIKATSPGRSAAAGDTSRGRSAAPEKRTLRRSAFSPTKIMNLVQGLDRVARKKTVKPEEEKKVVEVKQETVEVKEGKLEENKNAEVVQNSVEVEVKKEVPEVMKVVEENRVPAEVIVTDGDKIEPPIKIEDVEPPKNLSQKPVEIVAVNEETKVTVLTEHKSPSKSKEAVEVVTIEEDEEKVTVKSEEPLRAEPTAPVPEGPSVPSSVEEPLKTEPAAQVSEDPSVPSKLKEPRAEPKVQILSALPYQQEFKTEPTIAKDLPPPPPVFQAPLPPPPPALVPPFPFPPPPPVFTPNHQLPCSDSTPSMVTVDPVTLAVSPFPSATARPIFSGPVIPGLPPPHPTNLFFAVNGEITMPVFSLDMLRHLSRIRTIRNSLQAQQSRYSQFPVKEEQDDSQTESESEEEDEEYKPVVKVKKKSTVPGGDPSRPYECHLCGSRFVGNCHLTNHLKTHQLTESDSSSLSCHFCPIKYPKQPALVYHIVIQHGLRPGSSDRFYCPYCSQLYGKKKIFSDKLLFAQHIRMHLKQDPNPLGDGGPSPPQPQKMKQVQVQGRKGMMKPKGRPMHRSNQLKAKAKKTMGGGHHRFICPHCEMAFRDPSSLKMHVRTHTGERPFVCRFCEDQRFIQRSHLVLHFVNVHCRQRKDPPVSAGDKFNYPCALFCGSQTMFASRELLYRHIVGNHLEHLKEESEYETKPSPRPSSSPSASPPKTYPPAGSRKSSTASSRSSTSTSSSTNSQSHPQCKLKCDLCPQRFRWPSDLQLHLLKHTGEKPFACQFCPQRYPRKYSLVQHYIREHCNKKKQKEGVEGSGIIEDETVTCPVCGTEYKDKALLHRHLTVEHKDKLERDSGGQNSQGSDVVEMKLEDEVEEELPTPKVEVKEEACSSIKM